MTFKRFQQFLEQKSKAHKWSLPEKSEPVYPAKGKYLKPDEYYSPGAKKDWGLVTADDDRGTPFGDRASPGMSDPKKVQPWGEKPAPAPKKLPKRNKKMKTEAFINKTSDLSDRQFTDLMIEQNRVKKVKLTDLNGKKFTPEPAETMGYVANLMTENENMMSRMVREIKRRGGMAALISEIFSHTETFALIEKTASKNARINRKLYEAVAQPRGGDFGASSGGIGPSGASAGGPLTSRKLGGGAGGMGGMGGGAPGMGGMTPPGPPGLGEEDDMGSALLDDEGGSLGDDGGGDGDAHHHGDGDIHIHHHHGKHGDDEDDDEDSDEDEDLEDDSVEGHPAEEDDNLDDDDFERHPGEEDDEDDDERHPGEEKAGSQATSGGLLGGGETGGGLGKGSLTL